MKIALFGNYNQHNFGDDLMAVLFGLFLQRRNVEFSVFGLHPGYAESRGFHVVRSFDELLDGKDMLVFGGGGFLCDEWTYGKQYEADRCEIIALARRKRIPIYGFSLGGNGRLPRPLRPFQRLFLETARYISVRNAQDLDWIGKLDEPPPMDYFPDVVWQTSSFFPRLRKKRQRIRVGIQIHASPLIRRAALYLPVFLSAWTRLQKSLDFILLDTTGKNQNLTRLKRWFGGSPNVSYYQFERLEKDLDLLSSLDLLCSTQMHSGMVCLSYGIPFISLFGHAKTKLMLTDIRLPSLYCGHRDMPRLSALLLDLQRFRTFLDHFHVPRLGEIQHQSLGHFGMLRKHCLN